MKSWILLAMLVPLLSYSLEAASLTTDERVEDENKLTRQSEDPAKSCRFIIRSDTIHTTTHGTCAEKRIWKYIRGCYNRTEKIHQLGGGQCNPAEQFREPCRFNKLKPHTYHGTCKRYGPMLLCESTEDSTKFKLTTQCLHDYKENHGCTFVADKAYPYTGVCSPIKVYNLVKVCVDKEDPENYEMHEYCKYPGSMGQDCGWHIYKPFPIDGTCVGHDCHGHGLNQGLEDKDNEDCMSTDEANWGKAERAVEAGEAGEAGAAGGAGEAGATGGAGGAAGAGGAGEAGAAGRAAGAGGAPPE